VNLNLGGELLKTKWRKCMTLFIRASALSVLLCAGFLQADTVDVVSATWTGIVGGTGVVLSQANGSFVDIRWGTPVGGGQSGLGFDGIAPPPQTLPAIGTPFLLGTLRHYNQTIAGGTAATSADLSVSTNLNIGGNAISTGPFNFRFIIDETPNTPPCAYPSVTPCADAITFDNLLTSDTFTIGADVYTISIVGFADSIGGPLVSQFISQEGGTNDAFLYAAITAPVTAAVPEPSSIALLITIGAAVVVPLRRKFKAQA
jgi:hypothetical protein